jgi:hypothetical protein
MGRIALLTAMLYGWGDPAFDGRRPASLDRPLRDFHRVVNESTIEARRVLITLEDSRSMRYLRPLIAAL